MAKNYYNLFDNIVKANKLHRLTEELKDDITEERKQFLENLIKKEGETKYKYVEEEDKVKQHIDILKTNQYKKMWRLLSDVQKEVKMNEFIKANNITDANIIDNLKNVENKLVVYDKIKSVITEIKILEKNPENVFVLKVSKAKGN
jgi:hypothetical protein